MKNLSNLQLNELTDSQSKQISGGNPFAYAVGYVVATAQKVFEGAYASGYDEAQNNCECQ
jgi:hypothetical protein